MGNKDIWLSTLMTDTPQDGYELAIKLSRMGVKSTQPDIEILKKLRPVYAEDANGLLASSQIIALNFQTISKANNYWR
ncbi:MAG: peroxidase [Flavobacteriaceae bacterium]|nr:peroxidase [Flavobacteriaceae bacterium]